MSVLELQKTLVYGPINSRRLGRSLGINLFSPGVKVCTFDCCYCQYGRTSGTGSLPQDIPNAQDILEAVEAALVQAPSVDAVTFSGNGEPTMHPEFPYIVHEVCRVRDRLAAGVPVALLSNSSLSMDDRIRNAILEIDLPIMKLDAGSQEMLEAVNNPAEGIVFQDIVGGLARIPGVTIQALFIKGEVDNSTETALNEWLSALSIIFPKEVQVYSLDRPVPSKDIAAVAMDELESIAELVRSRLQIKAKAYGR
jgi:wyosine [tRNA(Phe)-imidazoG37] synthetase (radical SAM superfamily)